VKTICAFKKQIQACQLHLSNGYRKEPNDNGGPDLETKIHDLTVIIQSKIQLKRVTKLDSLGINTPC